MTARIYRPAKTAMSSGKAKTHHWVLEYDPERPLTIEPLMGYTSNDDMSRQIRVTFDTKEEAIDYAKRNGIAISLIQLASSLSRKARNAKHPQAERECRKASDFKTTSDSWTLLVNRG